MAGERTEKATPKRRNKAREEGQVSKSQDLSSAVTLAVGFAILYYYTPFVFEKFKQTLMNTLKNLNPELISKENFFGFLSSYLNEMLIILIPIMSVLLAVGIAVNYYQVGPLFTLKAIKPKMEKLSPMSILKGFKKFFQLKSIVELLKSLVKTAIVSGIGYSVIDKHKMEMVDLLGVDLLYGLSVFGSILFEMIIKICIILFIIGIIDKKYQDYEFEKSIKMTKQEIKDERKNVEGDPKIKAKIRGIQTRFAQQRMMSAIPQADVVVTNPTHYAVAIRYDSSICPAPQVVAKGVDYLAFKIREVAEYNKVPIVENKPLARTLYKIVPLEGVIPADLYVTVAELLAYLYRTGKGKRK